MLSNPNERFLAQVKRLIWVYFWLLIFEGVLRKWIVPAFSDPLLVIRDPVALAIYYFALRAKVFPKNGFIYSLMVIAPLSLGVGLLVLQPYLALKPLFFVTAYGFRSNFLHLPLIFVIGTVFDKKDVDRMGWWMLIVLIPMSVLMAAQFSASPDAFINRTAGVGEGLQITAGGGKIRPPATFSFVSGVIFYVSASAAFLIYGALSRGTYRNWLLFGAGLALVVAIGVSGSRSVFVSVLVVVASLLIILITRPSALNQFGRNILIVAVIGLIVTRLPVFKEGMGILSDRFTTVAEEAESSIAGNLITRTFVGFTEGFKVINRVPLAGYGLGVGTNAGAKLLTGRSLFLLAEGEWSRILLESGPFLGVAFILWRLALTVQLGFKSFRSLREGEILPIIIFSACFLSLLNGQFGQPTNLGFAVLLSGLCLASMNVAGRPIEGSAADSSAEESDSKKNVVRSRSPFAIRLHGNPKEEVRGP